VKGDIVERDRNFARTKLLLPRLAVYASPENLHKYCEYKKDEESQQRLSHSPYTAKTLSQLSTQVLAVTMSSEEPWVIETWHVRMSFRKGGFFVPEGAIQIPSKQIKGPNLEYENKEFYVQVTLNDKETIKVRCRLHHIGEPNDSSLWWKPALPIFPEDKEILDSMPMPRPRVKKPQPLKLK